MLPLRVLNLLFPSHLFFVFCSSLFISCGQVPFKSGKRKFFWGLEKFLYNVYQWKCQQMLPVCSLPVSYLIYNFILKAILDPETQGDYVLVTLMGLCSGNSDGYQFIWYLMSVLPLGRPGFVSANNK